MLGAVFLLYAAGIGIDRAIHYASSEFAVTNKRVVIKVGFINRKTLEMVLTKVETIRVDQSILGRVLNYGTIVVTGTGGTNEPFSVDSKPAGVPAAGSGPHRGLSVRGSAGRPPAARPDG